MAKESELQKLIKLGRTVGLDGEKLVSELATNIAARLPKPIDEEQIVIKAQARIGAQLSEVMDTVKGMAQAFEQLKAMTVATGGVSVDEMATHVAKVLEPLVNQKFEQVKTQIDASARAAQSEIYRQMDARFAQMRLAAGASEASPGDNGQAPAPSPRGSLPIDHFFDRLEALLPAAIDGYCKVKAAQQPSIEAKASEIAAMGFRLAGQIEKWRTGAKSTSEIGEDIAKSLTPGTGKA